MTKLSTLKKIGDFTLIWSNFSFEKWADVVAVGLALLVVLGGGRGAASFPPRERQRLRVFCGCHGGLPLFSPTQPTSLAESRARQLAVSASGPTCVCLA